MNSDRMSLVHLFERYTSVFRALTGNLASYWHNIPLKWRRRITSWLVPITVGQIVILIWGPGAWLSLLISVSLLGWVMKQTGFRSVGKIEALLGKVWDYFRGSILFALLPVLWQVLKSIASGDISGGLIQLAVLGNIVAFVYERFKTLPKSWTKLMSQKPRKVYRRWN